MRLTNLLSSIPFALLLFSLPALGQTQACDWKQANRNVGEAELTVNQAEREVLAARRHSNDVFLGDCSACFNSRGACGDEMSLLGVTESQIDAPGADSPCGRVYTEIWSDTSPACKRFVNQCSWVKKQKADRNVTDADARLTAARTSLSAAQSVRAACECVDCGSPPAAIGAAGLRGMAQDIQAK